MSAEQNIETVKAMYEAFGRGDVDAILERCTDDVDWAAEAAIEVAPWHGVKRGKAEVPSFFAGIAQTGPVTEFSPLSFTSNDDGDPVGGPGSAVYVPKDTPYAIHSGEKGVRFFRIVAP